MWWPAHLKNPMIRLAAVSRKEIGCCRCTLVRVAASGVPAQIGFTRKSVALSMGFGSESYGVSKREHFAILCMKPCEIPIGSFTLNNAPQPATVTGDFTFPASLPASVNANWSTGIRQAIPIALEG